MDVGTISLVLVLALIVLLAIGMPLGLASAALALLVLVMKFEPTLLTHPSCYLFERAACILHAHALLLSRLHDGEWWKNDPVCTRISLGFTAISCNGSFSRADFEGQWKIVRIG